MTSHHLAALATILTLGSGSSVLAQTHAMNASHDALSAQDRSFMMQAAQGGMAEVQFAKLADSKSSNATIKAFAQRMIADHGKANAKLMTIAQSKDVTLPASIGPANTQQKEALMQKSGSAFDTAYLKGQKTAHAQTAELFEEQIASGKDPTVVAFAKTVLPTVKEHQALIAKDMAAMTSSTSLPATNQ